MITIPTKCSKCKSQLDLRITDVRKDKLITTRIGWIIYGICEGCKVVYMLHYHDEKIEPTYNIDYELDFQMEVVEPNNKQLKEYCKRLRSIENA